MIVPFIMAGAGMALVFAPSANAVLSSVRTDQAGQASGANNAIREVGGVLGVAVLATIFTDAAATARRRRSSTASIPAMWVGVAVLGAGALGGAGAAVLDQRGGRAGRLDATPLSAASPRRARPVGGVAARAPPPIPSSRDGASTERPAPASHSGATPPARRRVPAAERREELIAAAVHEFAHGGLHGTPVERIARRVGVAQPYVFSLFGNKRELFLAALERSFERIAAAFEQAAADFREGRAPAECEDALEAMGRAYMELLASDRDYLMLQHQSYAACDDEVGARPRAPPLRRAGGARAAAVRRRGRADRRLLQARHGAQRRRRARRGGPLERLRVGQVGARRGVGDPRTRAAGECPRRGKHGRAGAHVLSATRATHGWEAHVASPRLWRAHALPLGALRVNWNPFEAKRTKRSNRELARTTGLVVLAVLMTLFAVFNLEKVEVSWIFGKGQAPLIVVIVLSVLVGVVFTHFAERRSAKRR